VVQPYWSFHSVGPTGAGGVDNGRSEKRGCTVEHATIPAMRVRCRAINSPRLSWRDGPPRNSIPLRKRSRSTSRGQTRVYLPRPVYLHHLLMTSSPPPPQINAPVESTGVSTTDNGEVNKPGEHNPINTYV